MRHWPDCMKRTPSKSLFIRWTLFCNFYVHNVCFINIRVFIPLFTYFLSLVANITKLEQTISDMELRLHREKDLHIDNNELKIKVQLLDKELLDAVKISKFLQEKNQMLEAKVNHLLQ